jgi:hypothetical protein
MIPKNVNKHFRAFDEVKDENFKKVLLVDERVFTTRAVFDAKKATEVMGEAPADCPYNEFEPRPYCGTIIVSKSGDWNEARDIAEQRGWGEEVDGILVEEFDSGDELLSLNPNSN